MRYDNIMGVPAFETFEYEKKKRDYALLIPVINESDRIHKELYRGQRYKITNCVDIVICDGGSTDGSMNERILKKLDVNSLLIKYGDGRQGTQLRMGIWWALERGYKGIITIDGNNKDSIEDVPKFIEKLEEGYAYVQGSRFIKGGRAIHTPWQRLLAIKVIHAPVISITARYWFTDSTNGFRGYSAKYLKDPRVQPLRDIFVSYELLAYLSVRATQIGYKVCEVPVVRRYPKGKAPTKITSLNGYKELLIILLKNMVGGYKA
jgi:glycosyltransferase involved in cell wall biosynthesis